MQHPDGLVMKGWALYPRLSITVKCAGIKQTKQNLCGTVDSGQSRNEAWQMSYLTLLQACQGKCYVLLETTTGWLEKYPVPCTAWNTTLGLGKQVLW